MTKLFEDELEKMDSKITVPMTTEFDALVTKKQIALFNPMENYFNAVLKHVDVDLIRKSKFRVGVDAMYGAGSMHFRKILESVGVEVTEIHADENPFFGGTPPEPVEKNLLELSKLIKDKKLDCGLATDGDADRLGAIDEHGNSFTTQKILSVVYWHILPHIFPHPTTLKFRDRAAYHPSTHLCIWLRWSGYTFPARLLYLEPIAPHKHRRLSDRGFLDHWLDSISTHPHTNFHQPISVFLFLTSFPGTTILHR